jgi:hypothetical protein
VADAGDRYRWLAQRIAGLRGRVGDDTVDRLLGDETEASLARQAIDGAVSVLEAGATEALKGELLAAHEEDTRLAAFFERPNGDARDVDVVRVVAAAALGRVPQAVLSRPLVGVMTAGIDVGVRGMKAAVRVGLGADTLSTAVEWVVDRAAAAAAVAVEKAAEEGGAKAGAAVGGWVGSFVGAAHRGAAVGAQLGRIAGARVGSALASGIRAFGEKAKSMVGDVVKTVGSGVAAAGRAGLSLIGF